MPRPWIEADEHGHNEHRVEVGHGVVTVIEDKEKRASVRIKDENPTLRTPVTGAVWKDSPAYKTVVASKEEGRRVAYRVETHRSDKIDPAVPFDDVGQYDKYRRLVAIEFAAPGTPDPSWFTQGQAHTEPQPQPSTTRPDPVIPEKGGTASPEPAASWRVRIVAPDEVEELLNKMSRAGYEPAHILYAATEKVLVAARACRR